jgi:Uncharacterized protein conserved in bacteria (DUF2188)
MSDSRATDNVVSERRRIVRPSERGGWAVCLPNAGRAVVVLPTRGDAVARAKRILGTRGGGEVEVHQDGEVLELHTVIARTSRRFGNVPAQRRVRRR